MIASGALVPTWLGWAPALVVFSMPGATLLWVLRADGRRRPGGESPAGPAGVSSAVLSVMLSTAIVIVAAVALDCAGIAVERISAALCLAAVQGLLAVACLVRGEPVVELVARVPPRLLTGAVMATLGAASLVITVVGVRTLAPQAPTLPYTRISWAAAPGSTGIQAVSSGPFDATVSVETAGSAGSVQLQESLDGGALAPPVTVQLRTGIPVDVSLPATFPRLDGCPHRVQVTLSLPGGGGDETVTRYVRGVGAGGCRGAS